MLADNISVIRRRIAAAADRANRSAADIKLVAVSKHVALANVMAAMASGLSIFGENYIQEALEKIPQIKARTGQHPIFHFIGKLQRNKAKKAVELFDVIETVDSTRLGLALDRHCSALGKTIEAYIQVNVGGESQKSGVPPEACGKILHELGHCRHLQLTGLMTMPPFFAEAEKVRPYFRQLRHLSEELRSKGLLGAHGPVELSMGMSGDFAVAIEEGATVVRIGTAIFGARSA